MSEVKLCVVSIDPEKTKGALNILDWYHIMAKMGKAIDKVRAK